MSRITRKTVAAVCAEHPDYAPLIRAVVRAAGVDSLGDVYRHGARVGIPGLIYSKDTRRLSWAHRAELRRTVEDQAEDLGGALAHGSRVCVGWRGLGRLSSCARSTRHAWGTLT